MLDRPAAVEAARKVLEAAPVLEVVDGGDGSTPIVSLSQLVDAVLAAANPEALVLPAYDEMLAQSARYRLEQNTASGVGAQMSLTAHPGGVAVGVHSGDLQLVAGLVGSDSAWHTGIAWCVAALESKRLHEEKTAAAQAAGENG